MPERVRGPDEAMQSEYGRVVFFGGSKLVRLWPVGWFGCQLCYPRLDGTMAIAHAMKAGSFRLSVVVASSKANRENMLTPIALADSQFLLHGPHPFNTGLEALSHGRDLGLVGS